MRARARSRCDRSDRLESLHKRPPRWSTTPRECRRSAPAFARCWLHARRPTWSSPDRRSCAHPRAMWIDGAGRSPDSWVLIVRLPVRRSAISGLNAMRYQNRTAGRPAPIHRCGGSAGVAPDVVRCAPASRFTRRARIVRRTPAGRHRSENGCIPLSLSAVAVGKLVIGLGIGQVISWGTLIYSIAVLGGPMGVDLEASSTVVFGAFSFSLVVSGAVGPYVGRLIDRIGGRPILAWGSFGAAASLLALSFASSISAFFLAWALAGIARAMTLYEAA